MEVVTLSAVLLSLVPHIMATASRRNIHECNTDHQVPIQLTCDPGTVITIHTVILGVSKGWSSGVDHCPQNDIKCTRDYTQDPQTQDKTGHCEKQRTCDIRKDIMRVDFHDRCMLPNFVIVRFSCVPETWFTKPALNICSPNTTLGSGGYIQHNFQQPQPRPGACACLLAPHEQESVRLNITILYAAIYGDARKGNKPRCEKEFMTVGKFTPYCPNMVLASSDHGLISVLNVTLPTTILSHLELRLNTDGHSRVFLHLEASGIVNITCQPTTTTITPTQSPPTTTVTAAATTAIQDSTTTSPATTTTNPRTTSTDDSATSAVDSVGDDDDEEEDGSGSDFPVIIVAVVVSLSLLVVIITIVISFVVVRRQRRSKDKHETKQTPETPGDADITDLVDNANYITALCPSKQHADGAPEPRLGVAKFDTSKGQNQYDNAEYWDESIPVNKPLKREDTAKYEDISQFEAKPQPLYYELEPGADGTGEQNPDRLSSYEYISGDFRSVDVLESGADVDSAAVELPPRTLPLPALPADKPITDDGKTDKGISVDDKSNKVDETTDKSNTVDDKSNTVNDMSNTVDDEADKEITNETIAESEITDNATIN